MIAVARYEDRHFNGVKAVWEEAFPDDSPRNRAEHAVPAKVAFQPELFLVALDDEEVVGTTMAGYDGHRGWLYSVAVRKACRRRGVATLLVLEAERRLIELGCEKINLQVRAANSGVVALYSGLGYQIEDRISMGKRV